MSCASIHTVPAATGKVVGIGPAGSASGRSKNGVADGARQMALCCTGAKMSNQCNLPSVSTNGPIDCGSIPATEAGVRAGFPIAVAGRLRRKTSGTGVAGWLAAALSTTRFNSLRSADKCEAAGALGKPLVAVLGSTSCARRLLASAARAVFKSAAVVVPPGLSPAVNVASLERADDRSIADKPHF